MTDINATPDALQAFRDALARFRYEQRDVADRGDYEIDKTRASLEGKAERWRLRLEHYRTDLARCEYQSAGAAAEGRYVDCSGFARAVAEAEGRLENVRRWQQRVEQEADAFRGAAGRFRDLLDLDVPRTDAHLLAIIDGLQAVRDAQVPGSLAGRGSMSGRPDQDGGQHLNLLDAAWGKTQERWDDDMSRHFDARYWMPLLNESRAYLSALDTLLELLAAAERDTEY